MWSPLRLRPHSHLSPPPSAPWNFKHSLQTFVLIHRCHLQPPVSSRTILRRLQARCDRKFLQGVLDLPQEAGAPNPVSAAPVHHPGIWPVPAVTETGDARSVGGARHLHAGFYPQLNTTTHKFAQTKTNTVTMTAHVCLMMQKEPEVTQNRDSRRLTEEKIIHIQSLHIILMMLILWFSTVWT